MRIILIILAILWLVYRLTPLNNTINDYLGLKGTLLDTTNSRLFNIYSDEHDLSEPEHNIAFHAKHTILTFAPVVILIGIAFVL